MKYDNLRAFEKHLSGASHHHFSPVYTLLVKESFDCKEALEITLKHLFPNGRDNSIQTYEGSSLTAEDILLELNSISFLVPKRVFIIQQADKLKKNIQEVLEHYLNHPQSSNYLILIAPALSKTSSFYKKIEKEGVVLEISELKPWEKERHLIERVTKQSIAAGKMISQQTCQFFIKQVGTDPSILQQEFEKLLCFVGDNKEITNKDVGAICCHLSVDSIWQLGDAIFRFDALEAVSISKGILLEGNSLLPLLRQIRSQFQTGYQISTLLHKGGGGAEITKEFPYIKGQILEKYLHVIPHYGMHRYKQGLLAIDETEMQVKNSQTDESFLAELLMIKLSTN